MTVLAEIEGTDVLTDVLASLRLRGRLFCRSELSAPWSLSLPAGEFAHFHVIERGGCWIRVAGDDRPKPLASGDLVVLPYGQGHTLSDNPEMETPPMPIARLLAGTKGPGPGSSTLLRHGGGGAETALICGFFRFEGSRTHPLLSVLPPLLHIQGDGGETMWTTGWLGSTLRFLAAEARHPRPGTETLISRLTDVIFVQALRAWIEGQPEGVGGWLGALRDRQIAAALGEIHRQPERNWSVASLAAAAGMSRSSFAARFTALVGEAPLAYLTRWRMHLASEFLRGRDLSVSEIAGRVGYESEAAFSKAFKREVGVSPGAYRRSEPPEKQVRL
jgi:AraC-like DNA-binding protein